MGANRTIRSVNKDQSYFPPVESKTRTHHERVGSGSPAERPGGVAQDWVPTELFARETKVHRSFQSTFRIPNSDISRAGRFEAPGGAAERGRTRLGASRIVCLGNKRPPFPPRHRRKIASTPLQKHEQAKSYVNRRRNQISS